MAVPRIIGFVFFITLILLAMGDPIIFLDISSLSIALLGALGMLLLGGSNIPVMFKAVFSGDATPEELRAGISGWQRARACLLAAGVTCVLIGLIIILKNIGDPALIGPGMALALLGSFYALVLGFGICLPLQARLEDRAGASAEGGLTLHAALVSVFTFFLAIGLLAILIASFSGGSQG